MPQIIINVTDEELKAVNGIVEDAETWLKQAWVGKAANCIKRVILEESNLNPSKMSDQDKSDWIRDNPFKTRKDKELRNGTDNAQDL